MSTRHLATLTKHHENSSTSLTLSTSVQILMASSYVFIAKNDLCINSSCQHINLIDKGLNDN